MVESVSAQLFHHAEDPIPGTVFGIFSIDCFLNFFGCRVSS